MNIRRKQIRPRERAAGLTLVELVVVAAILAVLAVLAIPSYRQYLQRGHRAEAVRTLLEMAACQERVRAGSGYYDTRRCLENTDSEHYLFRFEPEGREQTLVFRGIASPVERSNHDRCAELYLDQAGTRAISGKQEYLADCWGGR
jgi:type IV pilus assembly protein PilE